MADNQQSSNSSSTANATASTGNTNTNVSFSYFAHCILCHCTVLSCQFCFHNSAMALVVLYHFFLLFLANHVGAGLSRPNHYGVHFDITSASPSRRPVRPSHGQQRP